MCARAPADKLAFHGNRQPPYATTDRYSNWELSADRANAARRVMEAGGLRPPQVSSVRGMADRQLRAPGNPMDARNRRVSILVKSPLLNASTPAAPGADAHGMMSGRTH
jgi:chemotaxis protein MotB